MDEKIFSEKLRIFLKSKKISQKQVAEDTESTAPRVNNLISGREKFGLKTANQWGALYGIDPMWLMTQGEQGMAPNNTTSPAGTIANNVVSQDAIPFYEDYYFGCSPSGFMEAITKGKATSFITLPGLVNDGDTFVVPARGDSMINASNPDRSIPNGSLVAVRKTRLSSPRWGEVYALATSDGCIIKRLYPSDRDGYVKCVSFNTEEYPPFELESSEIYDIGIVVAVVNVAVWS